MSNDWNLSKEVFAKAVQLPSGERAAYLDAACDGNVELRALVESLLTQHDATREKSSPGALGAIERIAADLLNLQSRTGVGMQVGPWRLTSLIAHGGMGAVYLAERVGQFEQRAAVKLINPGVLSEDAKQRFNSERQILARLNHPNIARLIDGGTGDEGVPWLAMEYIEGARMDDYCRRERLDLRARLTLYRKVCAAVAYAHRNLIVHRDIKPSNILVDVHGEPKLLDFGVAKLVAADQPDTTLTVTERRALTPRYASPEQLRGLPLSTSTDIYSLGVLLYELLSGSDPYRVPGTDVAQLHHAILEVAPEPPSSTLDHDPDLVDTIFDPAKLRRELKGDLDNIVLMALRKEPERRYASVQELSDDIEHYLNDEPVTAQADTWRYRSGKFFKRNRGIVLAATSAVVVLTAMSTVFVARIVAERDTAEAARARAEQMSQFLQDMLSGADRFANAGKDVTVRDILDSGAQRIQTELKDQPVEQARMLQTIATTYHSLSMYKSGLQLTEQALAIRKRVLGATHIETLQSMRMLGVLLHENGDAEKAVPILEKTRDQQIASFGATSNEVAATRYELAAALHSLGKPVAALAEARAAYDILVHLPPNHKDHQFEPRVLNLIGQALCNSGDSESGIAAYRQALAQYERLEQPDDPIVGAIQHNIGLEFRKLGKLEEALPYLRQGLEHTRRILGERSEDYEVQLSSLGRTLGQLGRYGEAHEIINQDVALSKELYGPEHPNFAYSLINQARLFQLQGRHVEAVAVFDHANGIYRKAYGPYHRFLAAAEIGEADSLIGIGRFAEAERMARGALERMHADPDHEPHVEAVGRSVWGRALGRLGRDKDARPLLVSSLADLRKLYGDEHQLTAMAASYLVEFLDARGETAAADEYRKLLPADKGK